MNGHNITNESLALSMVLVLIAILVSYREKLALEKDIIWSICRAIVQLIIVGYVLKYIFNVNHAVLTLLMVLFICFNAAWNAKSAVNISIRLLSRRLSPSPPAPG
jgi:putative ABC transport system permease protein